MRPWIHIPLGWARRVGAAFAACAATLALCAGAEARLALPVDPTVETGRLENGLRYAIKAGSPEEGVSVRMVVGAGALREPEGQRAVADLALRMVFGGAARFGDDARAELLAAFGPGGAADAYLTLETAHIVLDAPRADDAALRAALRLCADALTALENRPGVLDRERDWVRSRWEAFNTAHLRVQRQIFRGVDVGSKVGDRFPYAPTSRVDELTPEQVLSFHEAWYTPDNAVLVVVGGFAADTLRGAIEKEMSGLPARAAPPRPDSPITPLTRSIGVVASDDEYNGSGVDIVRIEPAAGPPSTEEGLRRDMLRSLALRVLTRRLDASALAGRAAFDSARAYSADIGLEFRIHNVYVTGARESWREMLADLVAEVRRTTATGVSETEIDHARAELLAEQRQSVASASAAGASATASTLSRRFFEGHALMSEAQRLELTGRLLERVAPEEVVGALAHMLDPERSAFVVSLPDDAPSPAEVLAAAQRKVGPVFVGGVAPEVDKPVLGSPGEPGRVVEMQMHAQGGVLSAWLSNGVRVHHREMDDPLGMIHVSISIAGGRIEETARTRGLTDAASVALTKPATAAVSNLGFRDLLAGTSVSLSGRVGDDRVALTISASPEDIDLAMLVAHWLLRDAHIDERALESWRRARVREALDRETRPFAALPVALPALMFDEHEPRVRPLSVGEIEGLRLADAQAWLNRMLRQCPIEVGVSGAIGRSEALALAAAHLGSLPGRARVTCGTHHEPLRRAGAGGSMEVTLDSDSSQAFALVGLPVPGGESAEEELLLDIAAHALRARLTRAAQGRAEFVFPPQAVRTRAGAKGVGVFYAVSGTTGEHLARVCETLEREFTDFIERGPGERELEAARDMAVRRASERLSSAGAWAEALAELDLRGRTVSDLLSEPQRAAAATGEQVRDRLRGLSEDTGLLRLRVRGRGAPETP